MPISLKVTPGYTFGETDTVNHVMLNAVAAPIVELEDGKAADFANVTIEAGSAASPSIKIEGSLTTGLYSPAADQLGVSIGGAACVSFTTAGLVAASGKRLQGLLYATSGTKSAPGITFAADTDCGLYLNGSAVYAVAQGTDAAAWTSSYFNVLLPLDAKAAKFTGDVEVTGNLTVSGVLSGTIDKIADGKSSAPGLAFASDTDTGILRSLPNGAAEGWGVYVSGRHVLSCFRDSPTGTAPPMVYIGDAPGAYDWPQLRPAALVLHPQSGSGSGAICFEDASVPTGSFTVAWNNAPSNFMQPNYVKAWLGGLKVLIPVLAGHDW
jgi:hypothetical protein